MIITKRLKYFLLVALMSVAVTPVASAISVYGDAGVTLLNYKTVSQDAYLNPAATTLGLGASVDIFPFVDLDVHTSLSTFKNKLVKPLIEKAIEDNVPAMVRANLDMPAILDKYARLSTTEASLIVTPPLIIVRPYAGVGLSYNSLSVHQAGSDTLKDTAIAPVFKVGARMNVLLLFIGAEYKVNTAKFTGDFRFDGRSESDITFAPQTFALTVGISL